MKENVLLIGCGNMGLAMLRGWLGGGLMTAEQIVVVEPVTALRNRAAELGVMGFPSVSELSEGYSPRVIFIAVKPSAVEDILPALTRFSEKAVFVSVAAGVTIAVFHRSLGKATAVVRIMPNMPAAIGKGMIVTHRSVSVSDEEAFIVDELLKANGEIASVPTEALVDAATAVSGSGPAYVFYFIECLADAAIAKGIEPPLAMRLAVQTVYGASALATSSAERPSDLRQQVASPGGTTAAALDVLMHQDDLKDLLLQAVNAAHRRAIEISLH